MRWAPATLALALGLAACTPDINGGTYYCGPNQACPPDLKCDGATALCVLPAVALPFTCPIGSNQHEPDDDAAHAEPVGVGGCGAASFQATGCIDKDSDVDLYAVTTAVGCASLRVLLKFPVAFADLGVDVLDGNGAVVASGDATGDVFGTDGQVAIDITAPTQAQAAYFVRVRIGAAGGCGGACRYSWYQLSIL